VRGGRWRLLPRTAAGLGTLPKATAVGSGSTGPLAVERRAGRGLELRGSPASALPAAGPPCTQTQLWVAAGTEHSLSSPDRENREGFLDSTASLHHFSFKVQLLTHLSQGNKCVGGKCIS